MKKSPDKTSNSSENRNALSEKLKRVNVNLKYSPKSKFPSRVELLRQDVRHRHGVPSEQFPSLKLNLCRQFDGDPSEFLRPAPPTQSSLDGQRAPEFLGRFRRNPGGRLFVVVNCQTPTKKNRPKSRRPK